MFFLQGDGIFTSHPGRQFALLCSGTKLILTNDITKTCAYKLTRQRIKKSLSTLPHGGSSREIKKKKLKSTKLRIKNNPSTKKPLEIFFEMSDEETNEATIASEKDIGPKPVKVNLTKINEPEEINQKKNSSDEEDEFFLGEIINLDTVSALSTNQWIADISVNNTTVSFKIDSGADVTVIPHTAYEKAKRKEVLKPTPKILMGPCKHKLNCVGTFCAQLCHKNNMTNEEIFVLKGLERLLLGRLAAQHLNLIKRVDTIISNKMNTNVKEKYPHPFNGLGQMKNQEHDIKVKDDATPFAITVLRRVPIPLLKVTEKELERMERNGVISRVDEPTEWCAL